MSRNRGVLKFPLELFQSYTNQVNQEIQNIEIALSHFKPEILQTHRHDYYWHNRDYY